MFKELVVKVDSQVDDVNVDFITDKIKIKQQCVLHNMRLINPRSDQ